MIREEATLIKKDMLKEADAVDTTVDPLEAKMNQNDGLGDSNKALAYKDTTKKVEKEGSKPASVNMNSKDSNQGSDKEAATAVKVEAGAKKGGKGHTAGQANANFTSKKENQNTSASGPFDDRVNDVKMNSEDKLVDKEAKTYVSAGAAKGGKTHTAGQAKAEVHERMPEKDAEEPTDRIADGIEIDGSNIKIKESYSKKELKEFILSEAKKAAKNHVEKQSKESRKAELMKEFRVICESLAECGYGMGEEEEMEEGLGDFVKGIGKKLAGPSKQELFSKNLTSKVKALTRLGFAWSPELYKEILKAADADGYAGTIEGDKNTKRITYVPSTTRGSGKNVGGFGTV